MLKFGCKKPYINPLDNSKLFKISNEDMPAAPSKCDWTGSITDWGMMLNDVKSDCCIATIGHQIMSWSECVRGKPYIIPDNIIERIYNILSPNDDGCLIEQVLRFWKNIGIVHGKKISKITGYVVLDPKNLELIRSSINLFGSIYVGVNVSNENIKDFKNDRIWHNNDNDNEFFGHAVPIVKYDKNNMFAVTWGKLQKISNDWFEYRCSEAYGIIDHNWINEKEITPSGFSWDDLLGKLIDHDSRNFV